MFKWIALAVGALGIGALSYCFWPRAHIVDGKLITPSGEVFISDGRRVYVEEPKPEPAPAMALDNPVLLDLQRRPPANVAVVSKSDEIPQAPRLIRWTNAYSNTFWGSLPAESISRYRLEATLPYSKSPGDERDEDVQLARRLSDWAGTKSRKMLIADLARIPAPPEIPAPLPDPEYKHTWSESEGVWFEQMATALSHEQRSRYVSIAQEEVDPVLGAFDAALCRRYYSTEKAVASHNAGL